MKGTDPVLSKMLIDQMDNLADLARHDWTRCAEWGMGRYMTGLGPENSRVDQSKGLLNAIEFPSDGQT